MAAVLALILLGIILWLLLGTWWLFIICLIFAVAWAVSAYPRARGGRYWW